MLRGRELDSRILRVLVARPGLSRSEVAKHLFAHAEPAGAHEAAVSRSLLRLERSKLARRRGKLRWTRWTLTKRGAEIATA